MPLIYNALESEHTIVSPGRISEEFRGNKVFCRQVQEQALKVVPDLCETIDYAEVQGVLFPRVAVSIFGRLGCRNGSSTQPAYPRNFSSFSQKQRS
jgi:hypothetical protein